MLDLLKPMEPTMKRRAGLWIVQAGRGSYRGSWHLFKSVFWKFEHQHEMILVWEDGFSDGRKPRNQMGRHDEGFYLGNPHVTFSSTSGSSIHGGTPGNYPVDFAAAEMSSASHVVGKGILGKVAFTGNAHWIYSDSIVADAFDSVLVPEYPNEWLLQFAEGIKTILLLPLIPYGVLQLGSVEVVSEDEALLDHVKEKFESLDKQDGNDWRDPIRQFCYMPTFIDSLQEPSSFTTENMIEDENASYAVRTDHCNFIADQIMPVSLLQDFCHTSMRQGMGTSENVTESEFNQHTLGLIHVAGSQCQLPCKDYRSLLADADIGKYIHNGEESRASMYSNSFNMNIYGDFTDNLMDFHFDEGANEPAFVGYDFDSAICESGSNFFSLTGEDELPKAFETAGLDDSFECNYDMAILSQDISSYLNVNMWPSYGMDVAEVKSAGFPIKEVETKHLLEAVVANSCNSLVNDSSNDSNLTCFSISTRKDLTTSKRCHQSNHSVSIEADKVPESFLTSKFTPHRMNSASNLSSGSSVESKISELSDKNQKRKAFDSAKPGRVSSVESKITELSDKNQKIKAFDSVKPGRLSTISTTTNKRRSRTGHNQRPRPRDRQLIQDRIKDLRELVPNSEKCSIDGLLDKTIKHMLFLRGVTNQADKLRSQNIKEEADGKTEKLVEANYSHQNGRSWAVELGREENACPIAVKDLDHPGHLLIEMLCSDHGHFLEIADVIHRLQLTILKGVMKKRTDNSTARFIVETSGSFHRLDIFWPLMKLLQQSRLPISGTSLILCVQQHNNLDVVNSTVYGIFY